MKHILKFNSIESAAGLEIPTPAVIKNLNLILYASKNLGDTLNFIKINDEVYPYPLCIADNEVWYTTNDGKAITAGSPMMTTNNLYITPNNFTYTLVNNATEASKKIFKIVTPSVIKDVYFAFSNKSTVTSIILPKTVTSLSSGSAFNGTALTNIPIGCYTSIGSGVFTGNSALKDVIIPKRITSIGTSVFLGCSNLQTLTIQSSITSIPYSLASSCLNLRKIVLPESLVTLGNFSGLSNLTEILIPNSVTTIESGTFAGCTKLELFIPESVTSIGNYAFNGVKSITYSGTASGSPWGALSVKN